MCSARTNHFELIPGHRRRCGVSADYNRNVFVIFFFFFVLFLFLSQDTARQVVFVTVFDVGFFFIDDFYATLLAGTDSN